MRKQVSWITVSTLVLTGGLYRATAQEADPAAVEPVSQPVVVEDEQRAGSVGAKTGLKIFERENATAAADSSTSAEPIISFGDEPVDWLGALGQLWNDWRAGEGEEKSATANREGRRLFANRAFIRAHDADRSGDLSCDEIPANMENAFAHLDADHDGSLTGAEIRRHSRLARRSSSLPVETVYTWTMRANAGEMKQESLQEAYSQLRELDSDQNGKLDDIATAEEKPERSRARQTASRGLFGRRR